MVFTTEGNPTSPKYRKIISKHHVVTMRLGRTEGRSGRVKEGKGILKNIKVMGWGSQVTENREQLIS